MVRAVLLATAIWLVTGPSAFVEAREVQSSRVTARLSDYEIEVYTYRPRGCADPAVLFVFAGYHRDADRYRDKAKPAAERGCLIVLAPRLDRERFPNWRYHRVGVYRKGRIQPRGQWTTDLLREIVDWGRRWAGDASMPYVLFGHSAGGQLLSRFAAYAPPFDAHRIVIANPSVYVMPSLSEPAPYGFGGLFGETERRARLRHYLELPITIYLGTGDTGNERLVSNAEARRQGENRHARGRNVFAQAGLIARQNDWPFNWRLVEVAGVGHSSRRMLAAREVFEAFDLKVRALAQ